MATPGQLQLVGQELQVRLADNNWARIGSTVEVTTPPGPQILFPTGVKAKWKIVDGALHLLPQDGNVEVARINSDGSISFIAFIVHWGKRYDLSKKKHGAWKKQIAVCPQRIGTIEKSAEEDK